MNEMMRVADQLHHRGLADLAAVDGLACPWPSCTGISSSWTSRRPAGHEQQRALLGAHLRARDRRLQHVGAPRRAAPRPRGAPGRARWSRSRGSGSRAAPPARMPSSAKTSGPPRSGSATQATTTSRHLGQLARRARPPARPAVAQRRAALGRAVPDREREALVEELARHAAAHEPEPGEPDAFLHARALLLDSRTQRCATGIDHLEAAERVGEAPPPSRPRGRPRARSAHVVLAELLAALGPDHPDRAALA